MPRKKPKWQRRLLKRDIRHIRDTTTNGTLSQFKANLEWQRRRDKENGDPVGYKMTCMECHGIALKLGI